MNQIQYVIVEIQSVYLVFVLQFLGSWIFSEAAALCEYSAHVMDSRSAFLPMIRDLSLIFARACSATTVLAILTYFAKAFRCLSMSRIPLSDWSANEETAVRSRGLARWWARMRLLAKSQWIQTEVLGTLVGAAAIGVAFLLLDVGVSKPTRSPVQIEYFVASAALTVEISFLISTAARRYVQQEETLK